MATPVITWYKANNIDQATKYDVGIVDAGSISPDTTMLIWNNRGLQTDVSDMTSCTITTKDISGGNSGEIITNTWIRVKVDSMQEQSFTPIGGTVTKEIRAAGAPAGVIKGTSNDGIAENSAMNFAKVTLHANVPQIATAGNFDFITRVSYQYI
ncbi:gp361 [Bacillus phage G]|uniref:Gp361 n=1 Tax=Bacillus phage G TaxID=2884420 RepID=G3MAA2_9CAUD|nr:gp361 [Bacillus phage G]AEO93620.1 gp361 [Bacillus phage G]